MSYRTLNLTALLLGVVYGLAFFGLAALFRESVAAAAELPMETRGRHWPAASALLPGGAVGWGIAALSGNLSGEAGVRLLAPLALFIAGALGTALALEQQFLAAYAEHMLVPTLLMGAAVAAAALVHEWLNE